MPTNEKELNVNLFGQLEIVERIRREAKRGGIDAVMEQLDIEQAAIERKLYQQPPLKNEQELPIKRVSSGILFWLQKWSTAF